MVQDFDSIKDIIVPIFKAFPLQTNKRLDFNDFYEVVQMKEKGKILTVPSGVKKIKSCQLKIR